MIHNGDGPDLDALLPTVINAARNAGDAILEVYASDFAVQHKDDKSPLTLADKLAHEAILDALPQGGTMGFPVLSEEGKDVPYGDRRLWEYFWLVDPLDGTKEFIKRNGEFTVNIALIRRGRPILGVIYVPVSETFYYGCEGKGAFKEWNGSRLVLPGLHGRHRYTIVGSRSHATPEQEVFVEEMRRKHGEVDFISAGSSLKFCLVAEGKADLYPRFGPTMEWDTAAGQVIVEQAGSFVVESDNGGPLAYNKPSLVNPRFTVFSRSA